MQQDIKAVGGSRRSRQVKDIVKRFNMNRSQQRDLHDLITGQGYSFWEIVEIAEDIMELHEK